MHNRDEPVTREQAEEILRFLPRFEHPGKSLEAEWRGGQTGQQGVTTFFHPTYPDAVCEFFDVAGQPCWTDFKYKPKTAGEMLESDEAIASASIAQIKSMLTFCVRGERFCDGHWIAMIEEGRIVALLRRIQSLQGELLDS